MYEQDTRVDTVLAAVLASEGQLTEHDAAELVFLSSHHLRRIFRGRTGVSFRTYRHRVKMECARKRLRETIKTIDEIALDFGYASRSEFHRSFTEYFGVPPAQDRKMPTRAIYDAESHRVDSVPNSAALVQEVSACVSDIP